MAPLRVFSPEEIKAAMAIGDALEPVAASLIAYSEQRAANTPLGLMSFPNGGEAHIKCGYIGGGQYFVTKVATMVRANRARGLHTSDGVMLLCSAETGFPVALLHDRKYLTDIRTAAVGALAAQLLAPSEISTVGVFGSGGQAVLQLEALALVRSFQRVMIWAQDKGRAERAASTLRSKLSGCVVEVETCAQAVVEQSQILITATASKDPFIRGAWLRPGTHITALGADDAYKCELDSACLEIANLIVVDSRELTSAYGETARYGYFGRRSKRDIPELGELLASPKQFARCPSDITISKHVGLGVEDVAIATECFRRLMQPNKGLMS